MEISASSPAADRASRGKSRRRRQLTILAGCLLVATVLWLLRAFENEYTTRVDHPLQYINLPDENITLTPLPQKISLEVKGLGFSILRHNWNFSKTPLTIDIRKLKPVFGGKKKSSIEYLPLNQFINEFSTQLKDLKVLSVIPDTLMFRFAVKRTRTMKVIPVLDYESGASSHPDSMIRVEPNTIEVVGPDLILDSLREIRTLPVKINRPGTSFSRSIGLREIHPLVKFSPAKVTVSAGNKP